MRKSTHTKLNPWNRSPSIACIVAGHAPLHRCCTIRLNLRHHQQKHKDVLPHKTHAVTCCWTGSRLAARPGCACVRTSPLLSAALDQDHSALLVTNAKRSYVMQLNPQAFSEQYNAILLGAGGAPGAGWLAKPRAQQWAPRLAMCRQPARPGRPEYVAGLPTTQWTCWA
jgi:hypothetical protein